ncbi:hypothetical protein ONZ45_g10595 [Pleurotus djamor]|nr:hypothetical protein ONZ45_g10595 [Pleurotus djamor]
MSTVPNTETPRPRPRPVSRAITSTGDAGVDESPNLGPTPLGRRVDNSVEVELPGEATKDEDGKASPTVAKVTSVDDLADLIIYRTPPRVFREFLRKSSAEDWRNSNDRDKRFVEREVAKTIWRAYQDVGKPGPSSTLEAEVRATRVWMITNAHRRFRPNRGRRTFNV